MKPHSITGINSLCQAIHSSIYKLSINKSWRNRDQAETTKSEIEETIQQLEKKMTRSQVSMDQLTDPSRRAYQWLMYLHEGRNFYEHVETLRRIRNQSTLPKSRQVHLFFQKPLIKSGPQKAYYLHQGFINAPDTILKKLGDYLSNPNGKKPIDGIKNYTLDSKFVTTTRRLTRLGINDPSKFAIGEYQDLNNIFDDVNRRYFDNRITKPLISWTPRTTYRKFGQYEFTADHLLISKSLDKLETPSYVLSYLMYHELLHKHLGLKSTGSRKRAHTRQFRKMEEQHHNYQQAVNYLERISMEIQKKNRRRKFNH